MLSEPTPLRREKRPALLGVAVAAVLVVGGVAALLQRPRSG
ncbi:hypothetical protein [Xylanimonas protaetiae]|nr:hypothetical protein [Xylanimonas protaetiae]